MKSKSTWESRIKADIDLALEVDFVEWDDVYDYVAKLDSILDQIKARGEKSPGRALEAVFYFIKEIPGIFNNVHDECELGEFCFALVESAVVLTRKAGTSPETTATRLLEAYLGDAHETCRFDSVLELLPKMRLSTEERKVVVAVVLSRAAKAKTSDKETLRTLAEKVAHPRTIRKKG